MFCERCGYKIRSGDDYCGWCGGVAGAAVSAGRPSHYTSFATDYPPEVSRSFFEGLFTASGRINRRTLVYLILGSMGVGFALGVLDTILGTYDSGTGIGYLSLAFSLAGIWIGIAAYIKRLHDFDASGWWLLLLFVPLAGLGLGLFLLLKGGSEGANSHGHQPEPRFAL